MLNKGTTGGVAIDNVYKFLQEHGSLKWNEFAYDGTDYTSLPADVRKMRTALNTRVSDWETYQIPGTGTYINSKTDSDLDSIKNV